MSYFDAILAPRAKAGTLGRVHLLVTRDRKKSDPLVRIRTLAPLVGAARQGGHPGQCTDPLVRVRYPYAPCFSLWKETGPPS